MITRRSLLKAAIAGLFFNPLGKVSASTKEERILNLYNTHSGEEAVIRYFKDGRYDPSAMRDIYYMLRCPFTNEIIQIDPRVIDLLSHIKDSFNRDEKIHIISGYRSPLYNNHLRSIEGGVAKNSLHLYGKAIDFCLPSVDMVRLYEAAKSFKAGGVGRYSEFIHIDVGRVRYW